MNAAGSVNRRPDFLTKNFADLNAKFEGFDPQRVISIVLPFLAFNSTTANFSSIGCGLYHCYTLYNTPVEKTSTGNKYAELVLFISSTAVSILFPTQHFILSNLIFFGVHFKDLYYAKDKETGTKIVLQMISQAIHVASIHTKSPTSIVLSLVTQAGSELVQAYKQFFDTKNSKKPEALASLLLALIRLQKISAYMPHDFSIIRVKKEPVKVEIKNVETVAPLIEPELPSPPVTIETQPPIIEPEQPLIEPELPSPPVTIETQPPIIEPEQPLIEPELPSPPVAIETQLPIIEPEPPTIQEPLIPNRGPEDLKDITQSEWNHLCEFIKLNQGTEFHFETLLKSRGFSLNMRDLDFSQLGTLYKIEFKNISFHNCNFSNMLIMNCDFNNSACFACNFSKSNIKSSYFFTLNATRCIFTETAFEDNFINQSTFTSCDFSFSVTPQKSDLFKTTFTDCMGMSSKSPSIKELDSNPERFKNSSSPFTDVDHGLNGDLQSKIDANRVKIIDAENNEYDFGAYFHGYGKTLVKGANLQFKNIVLENGTKCTELSFEVNEVFRKRLRHLIKDLKHMSPEEQLAVAQKVQSENLSVESDASYTAGQNELLSGSAYEVYLKGFGTLTVGKKYVYGLRNQVKVTLGGEASIESFHHFLSVFGLEDAVKKSTEEDFERLKFGVLFKTFYPTQSYFMEKEGSFFTRPLEEIKQEIFDKFPKMKKIVEEYKVERKELFPGYVKYGTNVAQRAYDLGARALTTALTSLSEDIEDKEMSQLANILKNGLFSKEMRDKNGITAEGLNDDEVYYGGGNQSAYAQLLMQNDLIKQKKIDSFYYDSPVRLYISLETLNQGCYQYLWDNFGVRGDEGSYIGRQTLFGFIKRDPSQFSGHEIMIPDRVLPSEIKAMSVESEEIKARIISYLQTCGVIQDGMINSTPVDEFIRTEDHLTPDLVKRCAPELTLA